MEPKDYSIRISRVTQEQAYDASGKLVEVLKVEFNVGQHGPFIKRFAAANFDQTAARAEIQTFALALQQLDT